MSGRRTPIRRRGMLAALLGPIALSAPFGCAWIREHEARRIPEYGIIDPTQPRELRKSNLPPYVVEPPDELEVEVKPSVFDITPRIVTVQPDGFIDLGFGGEVFVSGQTLNQAEARVADHLRQLAQTEAIDLEEPVRVSLRLADQSQSKEYYVLGTVQTEGSFPFEGGETVLQAILEAGLRSNSVPEKAYLVRPQQPGQPNKILRIDWTGITKRGDPTTNYQVFPGDRIIVPGTSPPGLLQTLIGGGG